MITLGLTGSIGMGKSTVADMFRAEGVPVFDADAAVHALQGPGGALLGAIEAAFPRTTGPSGVDRQALGSLVFDDAAAMRRLEDIVHPAVADARLAFFAAHAAAPIVVVDVPLLFETGGAAHVDKVVVVSAPETVQRDRVLARPGQSAARFAQILTRQMPDAQKRALADYVIDTGASLDETRAAVRALLSCLMRQAG